MLVQWNGEDYTAQCGSNRDVADIKVHFHARWCIHESLCHFYTIGKSYNLNAAVGTSVVGKELLYAI
jgi:hypothetical protein